MIASWIQADLGTIQYDSGSRLWNLPHAIWLLHGPKKYDVLWTISQASRRVMFAFLCLVGDGHSLRYPHCAISLVVFLFGAHPRLELNSFGVAWKPHSLEAWARACKSVTDNGIHQNAR